MSFKVAARTILMLGAELISSDGIAFYELIKNAFDARSKDVDISVVERLPYMKYKEFKKIIHDQPVVTKRFIDTQKESISSAIKSGTPYKDKFIEELKLTDSMGTLLNVLDNTNYIEIKDTGQGMSFEHLEEVYLTIGTRFRYIERKKLQEKYSNNNEENNDNEIKPILGEKGVGRLSVMRLGDRLKVRTKKKGEIFWNFINIDWTVFSHEEDTLIHEIDVSPYKRRTSIDIGASGTIITIYALKSCWSKEKIEDITKEVLRKLTDPFSPKKRYPFKIEYNGEEIRVKRFDNLLYDLAHAKVNAEFRIDKEIDPHLTGTIEYWPTAKDKKGNSYKHSIDFNYDNLKSICNLVSPDVLKSLGPFDLTLFWFNRRRILGLEGIGNQKELREMINDWAGGLMLYRDGFRVMPYGYKDDDWLDLDKKALGWGGFKVNRRQIVGKVDISFIKNPMLIDQTNREGLVDNDEKEAMITMLKQVLLSFKTFLDRIDREIKIEEGVSLKTLESKFEVEEREINEQLNMLIDEFNIPKNNSVLKAIYNTIYKIRDLLNKAKDLADMHEEDRTKYLHLAGVGLMAEILAHELNRASGNLISTLKDIPKTELTDTLKNHLDTFSSQLKTLQKRLKIIDPLSTRGRQVKETFNLVSWVNDIMTTHEAQFKRHGIKYNLLVKPSAKSELKITAVKGMIVQILENLISNSIYWLNDYKKDLKYFEPKITIVIDTNSAILYFSDNGPGIRQEHGEDIFLPFFSLKPFKIGRGLGLYISKEIATYNSASLYLSKEDINDSNKLSTFILELGDRNDK
ncbi:MAG: sensor histidine kinase [Nitrospirae bacterium]|nr:sensor histidine kinase [Nitrospirota bacterium]